MEGSSKHRKLDDHKLAIASKWQRILMEFPTDLEKELPEEGLFPRCATRINNAIIYVVAETDQSFDQIKSYGIDIKSMNSSPTKDTTKQRVSMIAEVLTPEGYIAMQTGDNVLIARWQEPASCISIDEYKEAVRNHELIGVA